MRKTYFLTTAVIAVSLAGCGTQSDPNKREPGKWKTEMTLVNFDMTGVPANMQAQMAQMKPQIEAAMAEKMKSTGIAELCLSAEQSAKENVSEGLTQGFSQGGTCKETMNKVADGKIDFAADCNLASQAAKMTMNGTMESKKIDALMTFDVAAAAGKPGMNMKIKALPNSG